MPKIVCKDTNCQHNCCSECLKETIKVSKKAFCHSFDGKHDGVSTRRQEMYGQEFAKEFDEKHCSCQKVCCEARNCVSNENGYCIKPSIEVNNKDFGAKCISFVER